MTRREKATSSSEFQDNFNVCIETDQYDNKFFSEWREKLNKEMSIFNGKTILDKADGETASTMSGQTGITGA
jgi:hypothetical protein